MAKLPGRIPADHAAAAKSWQMPEIQQGTGSKVIKVLTRTPPPRMLLRKAPAKSETSSLETNSIENDLETESLGSEPLANMPSESTPSANKTPASKPSTSDDDIAPAADDESADVGQNQSVASHTEHQSAALASDLGVDVVPPKTEADGYEEGFKKGETEGFVKGEKAGYDAGLAAGTEAGRTQAENTFNQEVTDQRAAITNLQQAFLEPPNFDAELQQELVSLITELTKTIVCREIKTQPEMIRDLVAEGLKALPHGSDKPRVFVNPSDIELLQSVSHQDVEFVADAGLARGGCRVLSGQSSVEAGAALRIRDALLATCRGEAVPEISEADLQALESAIQVEDIDAE